MKCFSVCFSVFIQSEYFQCSWALWRSKWTINVTQLYHFQKIEENKRKQEEERERMRTEEEKEEKRVADQRACMQQEYEEELRKQKKAKVSSSLCWRAPPLSFLIVKIVSWHWVCNQQKVFFTFCSIGWKSKVGPMNLKHNTRRRKRRWGRTKRLRGTCPRVPGTERRKASSGTMRYSETSL